MGEAKNYLLLGVSEKNQVLEALAKSHRYAAAVFNVCYTLVIHNVCYTHNKPEITTEAAGGKSTKHMAQDTEGNKAVIAACKVSTPS